MSTPHKPSVYGKGKRVGVVFHANKHGETQNSERGEGEKGGWVGFAGS